MNNLDAFDFILRNLGTNLSKDTTLLDFGCGGGVLTKAALERGINAYGCDINVNPNLRRSDELEKLIEEKRVRFIDTGDRGNTLLSPSPEDTYRLPFDDATFDVVISSQVLEHAFNYAQIASELHRVMKPNAVFLHFYPPRYAVIEGHIYVPFAGAFHPDWWLKLWAKAGIRNEFQKGMSPKETVEWNRKFMTEVNYPPKRELVREFEPYFDIRFVEDEFFKFSKRARKLLHPRVYSELRSRVMYGRRR